MRHRTLLPTACLLVTLAACGGSSGDSSSAGTDADATPTAETEAPETEPTDAPMDTVAVEESSAPDPAAEGDADGASDTTPAAPVEDDQCQVTLEGAVSSSFGGPGGLSSIAALAWYPDADLEMITEQMGFTPPAIILNCQGPEHMLTLSTNGARELPLGSTSLVLELGEVGVFLDNGNGGFLRPTEPVTMNITTFDETRIAGDLAFTSDGPEGVVDVTMTFDFDRAQ